MFSLCSVCPLGVGDPSVVLAASTPTENPLADWWGQIVLSVLVVNGVPDRLLVLIVFFDCVISF